MTFFMTFSAILAVVAEQDNPTIRSKEFKLQKADFSYLQISPKGTYLVVSSQRLKGFGLDAGTLLFWDLRSDKQIDSVDGIFPSRLCFSSDEKLLAIGGIRGAEGHEEIWILQVPGWKKLASLKASGNEVLDLAFAPQNKALAVVSRRRDPAKASIDIAPTPKPGNIEVFALDTYKKQEFRLASPDMTSKPRPLQIAYSP